MDEQKDIEEMQDGDEIEIIEEEEFEGDYSSINIIKSEEGYYIILKSFVHHRMVKGRRLGPYAKEFVLMLIEKSPWAAQVSREQ